MPIIIPPNQFVPYVEHFDEEEEAREATEKSEEAPAEEPEPEV